MPVIHGYWQPPRPKPHDHAEENEESGFETDSDSDDDFENHDSSELSALANGSCQSYTASRLKTCVIDIKLLNIRGGIGDTKRIKGKFDEKFFCSAWKVEVEVQESKPLQASFLHSRGPPSYRIRTDGGVDKDVFCLFLKSCGVHDQHVQHFAQFVESRRLEFHLDQLMATIVVYKECGNTDIAQQIEAFLENSVPGKALQSSAFTRYAHQLFPQRASKLLESLSCEKLHALGQSIEHEPWIFGYKAILYDRYKILGCEAKLKALLESKVLDNADAAMIDALFIYYAITKETYSYGHTYVLLNWLKWVGNFRCPRAPSNRDITHWDAAMDFLVDEEVLGTDEIERVGPVVYLTKLRYYEESIASCLGTLMGKDPWILSSRLQEEDFAGDPDQLRAANLIANMPVVVMSGKGGCGKTYVVSKVLFEANTQIKDTEYIDGHNPQEYPASLSHALQDGNEAEAMSFHGDDLPSEMKDLGDNIKGYPIPLSHMLQSGSKDEGVSCHEDKPPGEMKDNKSSEKKTEASIGPVLLTAPTGRAASILGKRTGIPSYTIHHVIYSYYAYKSNEKQQEKSKSNDSKENPDGQVTWKFADVRMLVCDECSLVSVRIFSDIIRILMKESRLQQLVLLGDIDQLPSIEPGNFLSDVFYALKVHGLSVTLRKNHRAESEEIIKNAQRIANRVEPRFGATFVSIPFSSGERHDLNVSETVQGLLQRGLFTQEDSQFIAFRRKDCNAVNELCCKHYNNHTLKDHKGNLDFMVRDKVCIGKNRMCFDLNESNDVKLCNGDIFFIKGDITNQEGGKKQRFLELDDGERILKVDFKELRRAKMKHAWARTIHTYQGSETDTIIYVVGGSRNETWQHVYTAVTRGKSRVYVVHDPGQLSMAVRKEPVTRQTRLREFLDIETKEVGQRLSDLVACGYPMETPAASPLCTNNGIDDSDDDALLCEASQVAEQEIGSYVTGGNDITLRQGMQAVEQGIGNVVTAGNDVTLGSIMTSDSDDDELLCQASQVVERETGSCVTAGNDVKSGSVSCEVKKENRNPVDDLNDCDFFEDDDDMALLQSASVIEEQYSQTQSKALTTLQSSRGNIEPSKLTNDGFVITRQNLQKRASAMSNQSSSRTEEPRKLAWSHRGKISQLSPSPPNVVSGAHPLTPERGSIVLRSRTSSSGSSMDSPSPKYGKRESTSAPGTPCSTPSKEVRSLSQNAMYGTMDSPSPRYGKRESTPCSTPSRKARSPSQTAKYSTRCSACTSPIRAGIDRISLSPKQGWVHLYCVDK